MTTTTATGSLTDISASTNKSTTTKGEAVGLADTFDNFLTLLTTQLQNQDPTAPMDSNAFTQQLVSFAGVEQTVKTNSQLETLVNATKAQTTSNQLFSSASLIGRAVEADGNTLALVDGRASFSYTLPEDVSGSFVKIIDKDGKIVYSNAGSVTAGQHVFNWNGRDGMGNKLKDGQYTISVSALDKSNNSVAVSMAVRGIVSSVISDETGTSVVIGETEVPVSNIRSVLTVAIAPDDTTTGTDTTEDTTTNTGTPTEVVDDAAETASANTAQ